MEDVFCQLEAGVLVTVSVPDDTPGVPYLERGGGDDLQCRAKEMGREPGVIIYYIHLPKIASCGMVN